MEQTFQRAGKHSTDLRSFYDDCIYSFVHDPFALAGCCLSALSFLILLSFVMNEEWCHL